MPRWTVYGEAIENRRSEEFLNNCFADLLDDSLKGGPAFFNYLFEGTVELKDGASVVATDRDPLSYPPGDEKRRIDITLADKEDTIIGIESKREASLKEEQLKGELTKLRKHKGDRNVCLIVLTDHLNKPELVDECQNTLIEDTSEQIVWTSWFRLAQRIHQSKPSGVSIPEEKILDQHWQPTISRAKKLFDECGYTKFRGIDNNEFQVSVWELWKQIALQIDDIDTGYRWPCQLLHKPKYLEDEHYPIDPDWMLLTFGEDSKAEETSYALLSNEKSRTIWVGLSIAPGKSFDLRKSLSSNAHHLSERLLAEGLTVIQFPLNWLVGRKTLPSPKSAFLHSKYDILKDTFLDEEGMKDDVAERFVIGIEIRTEEALKESINAMEKLREYFDDNGEPKIEQIL